MRTRLPLLLPWTILLLSQAVGPAAAQPPGNLGPGIRRPNVTRGVSLGRRPSGEPFLAIHYPWKVHAQPSVEVRLVTGEDPDPSGIRPLFFIKEFMKGEVSVKIYRAEDEAAGAGAKLPLKEKEIDFEILGRRNSLGKPAVCVARRVPGDDPAPGTGVVFCRLPSWSVNKRLLWLDLPREYFAEPGKIHVWFLRADKVLWAEQVDWPGYGAASKQE
jgi:hypothetical protein